jgi:hypothetical protein
MQVLAKFAKRLHVSPGEVVPTLVGRTPAIRVNGVIALIYVSSPQRQRTHLCQPDKHLLDISLMPFVTNSALF